MKIKIHTTQDDSKIHELYGLDESKFKIHEWINRYKKFMNG